jgi:hypothetical protein
VPLQAEYLFHGIPVPDVLPVLAMASVTAITFCSFLKLLEGKKAAQMGGLHFS